MVLTGPRVYAYNWLYFRTGCLCAVLSLWPSKPIRYHKEATNNAITISKLPYQNMVILPSNFSAVD